MKEPRTLSAAYKFYCERNLENAHSAEADTIATWQIIKAQMEKYTDLPENIEALHSLTGQDLLADLAGRLVFNEKKKSFSTSENTKAKPFAKSFSMSPAITIG